MKRFEFRLSRVLEYRQLQANLAQKELEKLQAVRRATLAKLTDTLREQSESWISPRPGAIVSTSSLDGASRYRELLGQTEARLKRQVADIDRKVDTQRKAVMETNRRCRLLEKLKDRRQKDWQAEFDRELEAIAADAHRSRLHATRTLIQER